MRRISSMGLEAIDVDVRMICRSIQVDRFSQGPTGLAVGADPPDAVSQTCERRFLIPAFGGEGV